MHPNSLEQCRQFVDGLIVHTTGKLCIADVGSYDVNGTYYDLFKRPDWQYVGFDIRPGPNVHVVLDGPGWNLPPEHQGIYDVVISGQCAEHVAAPWKWIKNVANLCKPGGLIWLAIPNTEVFHEHPIDCWRCWPDGMRELFAEAGLTELRCSAVGPDTVGIARKPCRI